MYGNFNEVEKWEKELPKGLFFLLFRIIKLCRNRADLQRGKHTANTDIKRDRFKANARR